MYATRHKHQRGRLDLALVLALAGGLLADVTRVTAIGALDRRLRTLTEDLGLELWPGLPAELHPPLPVPRR